MENFQAIYLGSNKFKEDITAAIKSRPPKRFIATTDVLNKLNDAGCQLNPQTLGIIEDWDKAEALCLKNFSAPEIQVHISSMVRLRIFLQKSLQNKTLKLVLL